MLTPHSTSTSCDPPCSILLIRSNLEIDIVTLSGPEMSRVLSRCLKNPTSFMFHYNH